MQVCRAYQIPHSRFLSWASGDREKAIEEFLLSAEACSGCGTRREEWFPHGDHLIPEAAYVPEFERCPGCAMLAQAAESDEAKGEHAKGVHIVLRTPEQIARREQAAQQRKAAQ